MVRISRDSVSVRAPLRRTQRVDRKSTRGLRRAERERKRDDRSRSKKRERELSLAGEIHTGRLANRRCSSNKLEDCEGLGECVSLESLQLQQNLLTEAPKCLSQLRQLRALRLDRNRLSGAVGPGLAACVALTSLDLSGNALTSLAGLAGLVSLLELDVSRVARCPCHSLYTIFSPTPPHFLRAS